MPDMTTGGGATTFVGRERELGAILDVAATAALGRADTILIEASSGLGATRLIDEMVARLASDGHASDVAPVIVRADDLPGWRGAPYAPFRVALEHLLDDRPADEVLGLLGTGAELLLPLLPRLSARLAIEVPVPVTSERQADRTREAIRGVLRRLSVAGPVVVIIEDLHALDAASRSVLAFLARTLGERPILIVGSYQPEALGRGHPLRATLEAVTSGPRPPRRVTLAPLDRGALHALVAALEGEAPSAPVLLLVAERSAGSPLIVEEVLVARRELSGASLSVPLEQMVVARAARRTPECRRVLRILAVADGPLTPSRLAAVAAAYDTEVGRSAPRSSSAPRRAGEGMSGDLAAGVQEALTHGFVEVVDRRPRGTAPTGERPASRGAPRSRPAPRAAAAERLLRIRHELIAAALNADLLPGPRRRMHAAVAVVLADQPEEAGRHWRQAHDAGRELRSEVEGAAAAEKAGAAVDALEHLERAIGLAGAPSAAGTISVADERALLIRAAEAAAEAGNAGRAEAFIESASARPADPHDRATQAELTRRLGSFRLAGGDHDGALAAFERVLELLPDGPGVERARALATMAQVRMLDGAFSEATQLAHGALDAAAGAGPEARPWHGHALCTLGVVEGWLGRAGPAIDMLEEALAIAIEQGGLDDAFRARANLATILDLEGRREAAVEVSRRGIEAAESAGLEAVHGNLLRGSAVDALVTLGRWREAREMAERALEWAPSGIPFVNAALGLAIIEVETSARDAAAGLLGRLFLELETIPDLQFAVPAYQAAASLALWRGDLADAQRSVDMAWARVRDSEDWAPAARTAVAALEVANAMADRARGRNDLAGLLAARTRAEDLLRRMTAFVEGSGARPERAHPRGSGGRPDHGTSPRRTRPRGRPAGALGTGSGPVARRRTPVRNRPGAPAPCRGAPGGGLTGGSAEGGSRRRARTPPRGGSHRRRSGCNPASAGTRRPGRAGPDSPRSAGRGRARGRRRGGGERASGRAGPGVQHQVEPLVRGPHRTDSHLLRPQPA